jgi:hypothetical protein
MVITVESVIEEYIPEVGLLGVFSAKFVKLQHTTIDESDYGSLTWI